jgi:hypothetical protein
MANEEVVRVKPMLVHCPDCEGPVIGEPRGFVIHQPQEDGLFGRYTLLACGDQGHPLLVLQVAYGGADDYDDDGPWRVYPSQDRPLSSEIPKDLREVHEEARRCLRANAYTAAVVMSGRTLEGACALHGVKGNNLQSLLIKMKEQQLIDGRLWELAETLRGVRNSASHFNIDTITKQDAEDAIAFSESLLDYLYVLNARFEALKVRRAKKTAGNEEGETTP